MTMAGESLVYLKRWSTTWMSPLRWVTTSGRQVSRHLTQRSLKLIIPDIEDQPKAPEVFVASWLDYCMKYGMGFAMSDGTISVHFNDSHSLVLAPGKEYFDHITPSATDEMANGHQENYPIDEYPLELKNKVFLLRHFEGYILERLLGQHDWRYTDLELTKGMVYITKYLRMKHVILFRLSNDILQVSQHF